MLVEKQVQKGIFAKSFTVKDKNEQGNIVLKLGTAQFVAGLFFFLIGLGIGVLPFIPSVKFSTPNDKLYLFGFAVLVAVFGLYWVIKSKNELVTFNEEKISFKNAYGQTKELRWEEVQKIEFKSSSKALFISTANTKIKVLIAYAGFYTIMVLISELFEQDSYADALVSVHQFYVNNGIRLQ